MDEMDRLEKQLSEALRRRNAPPGFETRVLAAAKRRPFVVPAWLRAAAAVVLIASGGWGYRWHRGMEAKRQLLLAVRIASAQVSRIQAQVKEATQ